MRIQENSSVLAQGKVTIVYDNKVFMCKDSKQQCMAIGKHVCDNRGTTMIHHFILLLKTLAN
jgi:hypothetical protein